MLRVLSMSSYFDGVKQEQDVPRTTAGIVFFVENKLLAIISLEGFIRVT